MTIKRFVKTVAVILCLGLLLCGCKNLSEDSKPNDKRFVSAIGFDEEDGKLAVSLEAIEAVDEGKVNPYVLKNEGENVGSVLTELEAESPRELSFTHVASIIFGESLSAEYVKSIIDFFLEEEKIALSTKAIAAENAEKILKFKNENGESSGYEIADIVDKMSEKLGIGAHSTLYEIKTAAMQSANVYALPFLEEEDDTLRFGGMRVYVDYINSAKLDYEQSVAYAVVRNIFEGGEIYGDNGVYNISSTKADIKADFSSDRLKIDIKVKANPQNDELIKLVTRAVKEQEKDIFGIANTLAERYPEIYENIEATYNKYYKNAEINVIKE